MSPVSVKIQGSSAIVLHLRAGVRDGLLLLLLGPLTCPAQWRLPIHVATHLFIKDVLNDKLDHM